SPDRPQPRRGRLRRPPPGRGGQRPSARHRPPPTRRPPAASVPRSLPSAMTTRRARRAGRQVPGGGQRMTTCPSFTVVSTERCSVRISDPACPTPYQETVQDDRAVTV